MGRSGAGIQRRFAVCITATGDPPDTKQANPDECFAAGGLLSVRQGWNQNRAVVVVVAVLGVLALGNEAFSAVRGLYAWAVTQAGQAMLLVGIALIALFLVVERFVTKS
jgi:hypothetical protein